MMIISTTRFDEIEVQDHQIVHMHVGLLGFEDVRAFCLIKHAPTSPFHWLQAITVPELAFVTVNPFEFFPHYDLEIGDADVAHLELSGIDQLAILTLVTIQDAEVTTNLTGPVLVNTATMTARQIVLADSRYGTRHALLPEPAACVAAVLPSSMPLFDMARLPLVSQSV